MTQPLTPIEFYVGIDPGLDGALAVIRVFDAGTQTDTVEVFDTPTVTTKRARGTKREYVLPEMLRYLRLFSHARAGGARVRAVLELTASRPGQGVRSMFSMGYGVGLWEMALSSSGIQYVRVPPQVWRKELILGVGGGKNASIIRALQVYPQAPLSRRSRGDHNRAEAVLLAEYARRYA